MRSTSNRERSPTTRVGATAVQLGGEGSSSRSRDASSSAMRSQRVVAHLVPVVDRGRHERPGALFDHPNLDRTFNPLSWFRYGKIAVYQCLLETFFLYRSLPSFRFRGSLEGSRFENKDIELW